ncbi:MAG: hypothetical protein HY302_00710 [Opitutae bacterium]|nr:hypothetical protein [Opitutae bacterium]
MRRRFWAAAAAALAAAGTWGWWSRAGDGPGEAAARPKEAFVKLVAAGATAGDRELQERAKYFDPTPLFFPTEFNFGQNQAPEIARRQPGQVFASYGAKLRFTDSSMPAYGQETAATSERLGDVLAQGNEAPFAGIGARDDPRAPLAGRAAFMEVNALADGKTIVAQALHQLKLPRTDFAPLEFLVVVGSAGVIGEPVLLAGSGWEEVDAFFRDYLVQSFHLGERVGPGRYRVVVGP